MKTLSAIGLMSGSSLDGLDIAYCEFDENHNNWTYNIKVAETVDYPEKWKKILKNIRGFKSEELLFLHNEYGNLLGDFVSDFINKNNLSPDIIASHGHTVFHNPAKGLSFQLGNGQAIANKTGIKTVADFRTGDILLGGQGAPLVPIGDKLLFREFAACINLGGIANISYDENGKRIAYDICPANQALNFLANKLGFDFDKNGEIARKGNRNEKLWNLLLSDKYYQRNIPKSLSNEYVQESFIKLVEDFDCPPEDKLNTFVLHISEMIGDAISKTGEGRILITGGGAKNRFLAEQIKKKTNKEIIIPDDILIDFKEALIFAFMGVLKVQNKINCLSSATGALRNSSTGIIFDPI